MSGNLLGWLRRRFYGDRETQDRVTGALRSSTTLGGFGTGYRTPIDRPPTAPVDLDPDLPWELRE